MTNNYQSPVLTSNGKKYNKIQFRRGKSSKLPILDEGEPGLVLDTEEFYIGKGYKNIKMLTEKELDDNIGGFAWKTIEW